MHEVGLLGPVVQAAAAAYEKAGASAVTVVALRLGALSAESAESLTGAWPLAVAGSVVDGAQLLIEEVPAAVWCPSCAVEREIDAFFALRCPTCGTPTADLVRGREFDVAYVDLEIPDHA